MKIDPSEVPIREYLPYILFGVRGCLSVTIIVKICIQCRPIFYKFSAKFMNRFQPLHPFSMKQKVTLSYTKLWAKQDART